jgi:hypothetical protein
MESDGRTVRLDREGKEAGGEIRVAGLEDFAVAKKKTKSIYLNTKGEKKQRF